MPRRLSTVVGFHELFFGLSERVGIAAKFGKMYGKIIGIVARATTDQKGRRTSMMIHSDDFKFRDEYRAGFNALSKLVFDIDFEAWYQKGAWDDRYICHSIVTENQIVANVSVSKMNAVMNGESKRTLQIGTVMTHPEHRGKGLSKQLMAYVLETYEHECDLFFLFANGSVLDFYPKFGFTVLPEHRFTLSLSESGLPIGAPPMLEKLEVSKQEHWDFIQRKLRTRKPVSNVFGIENNEGVFLFYALNVYRDCLYYSRSDEAVIVFEHEGDVLHLYDVVSDEQSDLEGLVSRLATKRTREVRFHFTPDRLIGKANAEPFGEHEDVLFARSRSDLGNLPAFSVPKLAHA